MGRLQQLFVEQEIGELRSLSADHLSESGNLSGQVALTLVLLVKELTSEIVDKLGRTKKIIP